MYPIHHIGIVVSNLEESIAHYKKSFGFEVSVRETHAERNLELAFLKLDNSLIELLASTAKGSLLDKFLQNRGPGIHHICYTVDDLVLELARLKKLGYELIDDKPRPGADNSLIAFLHPRGMQGVLTELCQLKH